MIGQVAGIVLFLLEVVIQYLARGDELGLGLGRPEWGPILAGVSVVLCLFVKFFGACEEDGFDQ